MSLIITSTTEEILKILADIYDFMIIFVSNRGHGKSSSLRHILQKLKEKDPNIIIKVFDISQSHYWTSPLKYRQLVTLTAIHRNVIANIGDCVYECGLLPEDDIRNFIASIVESDYRERYDFKLKYGDIAVKSLPYIIYCIEESNVAFDSYSLKRNDAASNYIQKFVSVGRNFNMSAFLCCTRMKGELSTEIRERSAIIMGKVNGPSELNNISKLASKEHRKLCKMLPKYHFTYSNSDPVPFHIPDTVTETPEDYVIPNPYPIKVTPKKVTQIIRIEKPKRMHRIVKGILGLITVVIAYSFYTYFIYY